MEELFKKKLYDPVSETYNNYNSIVCGCAPGGEIVIWLSNGKQLEEVTRVKGKEISRENQQQREEYFNNKTPKEQEWITNNPIPYGTWDKYDKQISTNIGNVYYPSYYEVMFNQDNKFDYSATNFNLYLKSEAGIITEQVQVIIKL